MTTSRSSNHQHSDAFRGFVIFQLRWLWWAIAAVALCWSLYQAGIGQPGANIINWGGRRQLAEFWWAALSPELTPDFLRTIGQATVVTFAYAVCGTVLSVGLGFVGGVLSSCTWWRTVFPTTAKHAWVGRSLRLAVRGVLSVPRAIHELIWGLIFLNIFGLDPLVAVLAIAIPFGAIVSKVLSEILDETPQEPLQVLLNSGASPAAAWLYGLLPQALPNLLSYTFYRFECSLRAAAVMGVIGAGGLGYEILLSLQSLRYHQLWTGFYALIVLNGAVDMWSAWVRRRMGFTSRLDINARKSTETSSYSSSGGAGLRTVRTLDWKLRLSWGLTVLAIPLCFVGLGIEWQRLWSERSRSLLADVVADSVPHWPGWDGARYLLELSGQTVAMSVVAIALAGIGGILLSFPAAHTFLLPGGWLRPVGQRVRWPI
ncbi:MAG: ABC transporter permease subunit, partial [Cyanobacteria bacterium J06597_1]